MFFLFFFTLIKSLLCSLIFRCENQNEKCCVTGLEFVRGMKVQSRKQRLRITGSQRLGEWRVVK